MPGSTFLANSNTFTTGQVVIASTGVPQQLPPGTLTNGITIKAKATNAAGGVVGPSATLTNAQDGTGGGYILAAGDPCSIGCTQMSSIWLCGTAGDIYSYIAN